MIKYFYHKLKDKIMTVAQYFKITYDSKKEYQVRNPIICNDGFKISVQGSNGHYCEPRIDTDIYISVECGFPSKTERLITKYAESKGNYTNTVYGWVPFDLVERIIKKHKGINIDKTFRL